MRNKPMTLALLAGLTLSGAAQAALYNRGGGLIYDDVLNITWLQDANYAMTSGYDADGGMPWSTAMDWVANLSYYDSVRGVTYSDWRLPTMIDTDGPDSDSLGNDGCDNSYSGTDCGDNVQTYDSVSGKYNELAYMYFVNLGNISMFSTSGVLQTGYGFVDDPNNALDESLFQNLLSGVYWYDLRFAPDPTDSVWLFNARDGQQTAFEYYPSMISYYAWAVRPGDVPEPATLMLLSLGLAGLGAMRRWGDSAQASNSYVTRHPPDSVSRRSGPGQFMPANDSTRCTAEVQLAPLLTFNPRAGSR